MMYVHAMVITFLSSTNTYAELHKNDKLGAYTTSKGEFVHTNVDEMNKVLGLLIYMGVVHVPALHDYWSTAPLLHGLWAQSFLSRDRFHALLAFLHVDDPRTEEGRLVCNW